MTLGLLFQIALVAIIINNIVIDRMLGIDPLLRTVHPLRGAVLMGVVTLVCMTIAAGCGWVVEHLFILPLALGPWRLLVLITVVCSVFLIVELLVHHWSLPFAERIRPLVYHSVTNSAVIGCALVAGGVNPFCGVAYSPGQALGFSFCAGLGFCGVQIVVAGISKRIEQAPVPAVMRGPGILLIVCSLLALCIQGIGLLGGR